MPSAATQDKDDAHRAVQRDAKGTLHLVGTNHGTVPGGSPEIGDPSPICAAPFVTMEFDPYGDVLACCANTLRPLGNVRWSTIEEIWNGPRAQDLRVALQAGDLSLGCGVCRHRLTHGHADLARDYYDSFRPSGPMPEWPVALQFSLHNTCNLACVMCGADRSSRIRRGRSGLEPLPQAYGARFFDELPPFLEHADRVDFSGGEPFLVTAHERVWDLMETMDAPPLCSVTTNGTVWNDRVERVLDRFRTDVSVSIDGMTPDTLERIRVGADLATVMANIERFRRRCEERGTELTLSWSLTRLNWWELGRALRWAEDLGVGVKVLTVLEPEYGLQHLPDAELSMVIEVLERESDVIRAELERNGPVWDAELRRLRGELLRRRRSPDGAAVGLPPGPSTSAHAARFLTSTALPALDGSELVEAVAVAVADLERWRGVPAQELEAPYVFDVATDGRIVAAEGFPGIGPDVPSAVSRSPGSELATILDRLATGLGGVLWLADEFDEGDRVVSTLWIGSGARDRVGVVLRAVSLRHADGHRILIAEDRTLATIDRRPEAVPVKVVAGTQGSVRQFGG